MNTHQQLIPEADEFGIVRAESMLRFGVSGHYVLTVHQSDGQGGVVEGSGRVVAEFDNLITDVGLDCIGNALTPNTCVVGSGGATPAYTDTALAAQVAASSTVQAITNSYNASPEYAQQSTTYRFVAGTATGNLAEIGMKAGTALFSRALILDGSSNPTTISILSTEVLDATFIRRVQPPSGDISGNVVIGGVTYNSTARPANVGTWYNYFDFVNMISFASASAYSGNIGSRSSSPTGTATNKAIVANSYSNGTHARTWTGTWQLNDANYANGIASFSISTLFNWQYSIDSGANVPKTASQVLGLTFNVAWDRV